MGALVQAWRTRRVLVSGSLDIGRSLVLEVTPADFGRSLVQNMGTFDQARKDLFDSRDPLTRRMMVEKRARKLSTVLDDVPAPELEGPPDADVTLVGWGSTFGVITEAVELLKDRGISANYLLIKWIVPFHGDAVTEILNAAKRTIDAKNPTAKRPPPGELLRQVKRGASRQLHPE